MNNTYLCFPYKFQKEFPLLSPKELTFSEFVKISNFTNSDYHFDEKNLSLTQQAYRVDIRFAKAGHTLTGVKLLAYHLMCLNTAHIYTKEYILAVANLFGITEETVDSSQKHFTKLYISYH